MSHAKQRRKKDSAMKTSWEFYDIKHETVFHRDIQILRRELKVRRAAEYL